MPQRSSGAVPAFDGVRAARMAGFGAAFYGPFQHYWYQNLERIFPSKSTAHFGSKVGASEKGRSCVFTVADVFVLDSPLFNSQPCLHR